MRPGPREPPADVDLGAGACLGGRAGSGRRKSQRNTFIPGSTSIVSSPGSSCSKPIVIDEPTGTVLGPVITGAGAALVTVSVVKARAVRLSSFVACTPIG